MMPKNILFVSHDASRTGAPIVLLNIIRWLKDNCPHQLSVYLKWSGSLEEAFSSVTDTILPVQQGRWRRLLSRVLAKAGKTAKYQLPNQLKQRQFDLLYLNTIVSLGIIDALKQQFKCPVICHIHENAFSINYYYPDYLNPESIALVDRFIAVSKSTRDNLVEHHGVPVEKIDLVYETIEVGKMTRPDKPREVVLQELGLTGSDFIVGGSGLTSWRKGADLFVQLAVTIKRLAPDSPIKLLWVGAIDHEFRCQLDYQQKLLGIEEMVYFIGEKADPRNYFQVFDVFALVSREDPFPLVALEAAALEKPILCFEGAGGIPEFSGTDQGIIAVPYGDLEKMALSIIALSHAPADRAELGKNARSFVQQFDVTEQGAKVRTIINSCLA